MFGFLSIIYHLFLYILVILLFQQVDTLDNSEKYDEKAKMYVGTDEINTIKGQEKNVIF